GPRRLNAPWDIQPPPPLLPPTRPIPMGPRTPLHPLPPHTQHTHTHTYTHTHTHTHTHIHTHTHTHTHGIAFFEKHRHLHLTALTPHITHLIHIHQIIHPSMHLSDR